MSKITKKERKQIRKEVQLEMERNQNYLNELCTLHPNRKTLFIKDDEDGEIHLYWDLNDEVEPPVECILERYDCIWIEDYEGHDQVTYFNSDLLKEKLDENTPTFNIDFRDGILRYSSDWSNDEIKYLENSFKKSELNLVGLTIEEMYLNPQLYLQSIKDDYDDYFNVIKIGSHLYIKIY